jgi:hypothetical protein
LNEVETSRAPGSAAAWGRADAGNHAVAWGRDVGWVPRRCRCLGAAIELRSRALSEGPVRGGDRASTVDGGMGASDVNGEHSGGGDRRGPRPSPRRL